MDKTKKIHIWAYSLLVFALIAVIIWGFNKKSEAHSLERNMENSYNRAFFELVDYIDNIDIKLTKAQLAQTPAQLASIANDIFSESAEAKSCLGQLPTSRIQLDKTAKFLSQVGDYTYVLSQVMINGEKISQEEYDTLSELNRYAGELKQKLSGIQEQIYSGATRLEEITAYTRGNAVQADGGILADMENIEKAFDEYPSLIYDGPFSEHIENRKAVMLENAEEISEEEALKKAQDFLGDRGRDLRVAGSTENTKIPAYNFSTVSGGGQISVSVSKKGGYVIYFLDSVSIKESRLNIAEATNKAETFLEEHGIYNMKSSYYEKSNNIAIINFAYVQNGTVCYSDLIKLRVALDSGMVIGFESNGYLMNHTEREINEPNLTSDEAQARLAPNLEVESVGRALIPKDSLEEVLCYEFKGSFNGKNFIVYINADNGREENILLLLEDENGILTI